MQLENEMRSYGSNSTPFGSELDIEHRVDMLNWGSQAHYSFLIYTFKFASGRRFIVRVYTDDFPNANVLDGFENQDKADAERFRDWPEFSDVLKALWGFKFFDITVGPACEPLTDRDFDRYDLSPEAVINWMPDDERS